MKRLSFTVKSLIACAVAASMAACSQTAEKTTETPAAAPASADAQAAAATSNFRYIDADSVIRQQKLKLSQRTIPKTGPHPPLYY